MVFETVSEATKLWIKGREFSIARLLGDVYRDEAERYVGGALAIFRLAPQDYHRFHVPVDGRIGKMRDVMGEYYTVNVRFYFTCFCFFWVGTRLIRAFLFIASSDSERTGRVWGEREEDYTHR